MKCEACLSQVAAAELSPSEAGQWLCRSCMARYSIALADRRVHALQIYRRCSCGAEMVPEDEGDVPLYVERLSGRRGVNLAYAFRATRYRCACGRRFKLQHPALLLLWAGFFALVVLASSQPAHPPARLRGIQLPPALVVLGTLALGAVVLVHQLYYRWRYPRVR